MRAPLVIVGMSVVLALLGLYAMARASRFRRLPCTRVVLGAAAGVFLLRALALPAIWVPALRERLTLFEFGTALLCFLLGLALAPDLQGRVRLPDPLPGRR